VRSAKVETLPIDVKAETIEVTQINPTVKPDEGNTKNETKKSTSPAKQKPKADNAASKIKAK
jgi:hypothetical protein